MVSYSFPLIKNEGLLLLWVRNNCVRLTPL